MDTMLEKIKKFFSFDRFNLDYDQSLWYKFKEFFYKGYRSVREFYYWIQKSCEYAWFLRKDFDWDYAYILYLLQYKITRTRKRIQEDNIIENTEKYVAEMQVAEKMLEDIINDTFLIEQFAKHEEKWGELDMVSHPCDDDGIACVITFKRERAKTEEEIQQEKKEFMELINLETKARDDAYLNLFLYLATHIRNWWN